MSDIDTVEPTLAAMQAASAAARNANHAAYDAPHTPSDVYDRTGALLELLGKVEQLAGHLAHSAERLADDPRLRSRLPEATPAPDLTPDGHARRAELLLAAAERSASHAAGLVNDAWSHLSSLHLDEET